MEENKNHSCNCGSGCGCGEHEHDHDCCCSDEVPVIHLNLDNGEEVECIVLGVFKIDEENEQEYIALLPKGKEDVLLYRFKEDGEEVHLDNIETDEEFEKVSNVFSEIFEQEFEEEE